MKNLILSLTLLTFQMEAQESRTAEVKQDDMRTNKPAPPAPPTPAVRECLVTNITFIPMGRTDSGGATGYVAHVTIDKKDCPTVWYYGLTANGEQRQWAIHDHDVGKFESGEFEHGITTLWRTTYHIPDIVVLKVNRKPTPERQWHSLTNDAANLTLSR